ncbi:MAG: Cell division protein CrgA [Frondihabitans sp.]|nr:Cell division protein CrgA [Frondihabitans sp.]
MRAKSSPAARVTAIVGAALLILSLAWTVVFYITEGTGPIASLGSWNVLIGFGLFVVGAIVFVTGILFVLSTRRSRRVSRAR